MTSHRDPVARLLAAVGLLGATLVGIALVDQPGRSQPPLTLSNPYGPPVPVTGVAVAAPAWTTGALPRSLPVRLSVPRLRVSARVLHVGQAADGTVAVPPPGPTYDQPAWYRYSPAPGSVGPAVIVGHVDSKAGGPSVFYGLGSLRRADLIEVTRADGVVARFTVEDVRRYRKSEFPTEVVYGNTSNAALRLVTCGGPFDRRTGHYLDNVVVTASLLPAAAVAPGRETPSRRR